MTIHLGQIQRRPSFLAYDREVADHFVRTEEWAAGPGRP